GRDATVEEGGRLAEHPQHPHEARGGAPPGVVVGDHAGAIADPQRAHRSCERARVGQRVATFRASRWPCEVEVDVDEPCTGDVPGFEGGAAAATVEVPPHITHDDLGE